MTHHHRQEEASQALIGLGFHVITTIDMVVWAKVVWMVVAH